MDTPKNIYLGFQWVIHIEVRQKRDKMVLLRGVKIEEQFEKEISKGVKMTKIAHPGSLFSPPIYDNRKAHSLDRLVELNNSGFKMDENFGLLALNILFTHALACRKERKEAAPKDDLS